MPARVAHPESIVETDWVAENLNDDNLALVEVDVDTAAYDQGHVPAAIGWNWTTQLNDTLRRDILNKEQMQRLLGGSGIARSTNVVLYGDNNNWFATYAFWQLKMFGHRRVKIMNGGRQKWIDEDRPTSTDTPSPERRIYRAGDPDTSIRATRDYVLEVASTRNSVGLVDVSTRRACRRRDGRISVAHTCHSPVQHPRVGTGGQPSAPTKSPPRRQSRRVLTIGATTN